MNNGQLTSLYLETNWTRFEFPYYVKEDDIVYYAVHTDITSLDSKTTWNSVATAKKSVASEFFKKQGYFTVSVKETKDIKLPLSDEDLSKVCDITTTEASTTTVVQGIFKVYKRSIDPRPDGTVKILYKVENASTILNIAKIVDDFESWSVNQPAPALSKGDKAGWSGEKKDFSLKLSKAGKGASTIKKGLGKVKDIKNLRDVNDFLGAVVKESQQVRMAAMSSHAFGGNPGDMDFAADIKETADVLTTTTRADIVNESLSSVEFISDYALFEVPGLLGDVGTASSALGETTAGKALTEAGEALTEAGKAYKRKMDQIFAFANKWGLTGLLECSIAHVIQLYKLQGNVKMATLMLKELKELTKVYKSVSVEFQQYKKLVDMAQKKFKAGGQWKGSFAADLKKAAYEALEEAGKQLLKLLTQFCLQQLAKANAEENFDYGFVPPQAFFEPEEPLAALEAYAPGQPISPEQTADLGKFLEDLFANLKPQEICSLLQGTDTSLLNYILEKIKKKYSSLQEILGTPQQVADFLYNLGKPRSVNS